MKLKKGEEEKGTINSRVRRTTAEKQKILDTKYAPRTSRARDVVPPCFSRLVAGAKSRDFISLLRARPSGSTDSIETYRTLFPKLRGDRLINAGTRIVSNPYQKGNSPLYKPKKFCRMTVFFNKEAVNMGTRNPVINVYETGGVRQPRRRALILQGEQREPDGNASSLSDNRLPKNTGSTNLDSISHQEA